MRSNSHIRAALSATIGNAARAQDKKDPYSWSDYGKELANGTMAANAAIGVAAFSGGLALTGTAAAPLLTTVGTITEGIGALQFACKKINDIKERW